MATNRHFSSSSKLSCSPTDPTSGGKSGDPCLLGNLAGVMLIDQAAGVTTMQTDGVFTLSVKGVDGSGNHPIAAGDIVYYTSADTPKLGAKTTGVRFGIALAAVTSGATTSIDVAVGR